MSKAGYIGVESAARKIKKMYVGVDGIARSRSAMRIVR